MKQVAILCNYQLMPERVGGMDYFFWQFDEVLKQKGYAVDWFFPNTSEHGHYPNFSLFASGKPSVEATFLYHLQSSGKEYDTIFCHFVELCTPFYKQLKQLRPALTIVAVDHNPRPIGGYSITKKISKRIKGWLYSDYIDTLVGVSQYTAKEIRKDFGTKAATKTKVIYNGVKFDTIQRRLHRNTTQPRFLTACHLRESKGIQDLIEAVSLLPESVQSAIRIDVYGDGEYKEHLQELIRHKQLTHQFSFKGNSPDLGSVYCQYDYLLHPSHMECFSLGILESLAANVPVITTTVGGNTEVIRSNQNGFLFPPKDIHQLKTILLQLYTGEKKIEEDTDTFIKQKFTLTEMVNHYIQLIR